MRQKSAQFCAFTSVILFLELLQKIFAMFEK